MTRLSVVALALMLSACGAKKNTTPKAPTSTAPTEQCSSVSNPATLEWDANRESAVNRAGGGYTIAIGSTSGFTTTVRTVNVPYVSGAAAPTSVALAPLTKGKYYVRISAYSNLGGANQSSSSPEICVNVN